MNRFTNKNGGILPFQMVKLAGIKEVGLVGRDAWNAGRDIIYLVTGGKGSRSATASKQYFNKEFGKLGDGVNALGDQVGTAGKNALLAAAASAEAAKYARGAVGSLDNLHKRFSGVEKTLETLRNGGQASEAQLKALADDIGEIKKLAESGNKAAAAQFNQLMQMHGEVMGRLPGKWGRFINGTLLAGTTSGLTLAGDRLLTGDANAAHAAGNDAAKEGELAELQSGQGGSWWDNTWNDINKFREEHPGWFYGLSGVGLLGSGYALSEMLDDDDDEEDEYRRY